MGIQKQLNKLFKNRMETQHKTTREFNYTQNNVTLKFALKIDIKTELEVFKGLMEQAIKDIDSELSKFN